MTTKTILDRGDKEKSTYVSKTMAKLNANLRNVGTLAEDGSNNSSRVWGGLVLFSLSGPALRPNG